MVKAFRTAGFFRAFWRPGFLLILFLAAGPLFPDPLTVGETSISLNMDGHLEDWPASRMITLDQASQVVDGGFFWKGPDQFSGRVFLTYDGDFLYVAALVNRAGFPVNDNEPQALWNGDCLELFLSADPDPRRLTRLDYHIGISPGTKCVNPQVWCFDQKGPVPGARVKSKISKKGYILEAALPLEFFKGLTLAPGATCGFDLALDEGGAVGIGRLLQMDYAGQANSWLNPSAWIRLTWTGQTTLSIPSQDEADQNSILVADGTKGTPFLGLQKVSGTVGDAAGHPLAGAKVWTWPSTLSAVTDDQGKFTFPELKLYGQTVFYAGKDGYYTSLGTLVPGSRAVTIHLFPMPIPILASGQKTSPQFFAADLSLDPSGAVPSDLPVSLVRGLRLNLLWLRGESLEGLSPAAQREALGRFADYAQSVGAQAGMEVPWNSQALSQAALGAQEGRIAYWALGDAPDQSGPPDAYGYVNDFRNFFNLVKRLNPSSVIVGPNLSSDKGRGAGDWLTPFLRFDGDIANWVSLGHEAVPVSSRPATEALADDIRQLAASHQAFQAEVSRHSDIYVPAVYSRVSPFAAPVSLAGSFAPWLWEADVLGTFLREGVQSAVWGDLESAGGQGLFSQGVATPSARVLGLFSNYWRGLLVPAKVLKPWVSVYACREPETGDVTLFILNESPQYDWFNIALNGQGNDLVVEGGLDLHCRFEVPDQGLALLRFKADGSSGESVIYTGKMAALGQPPTAQAFKP
ncbi:MAG TPA: sugar-binding protein [bacterium]|nr:sugar-binding protein [bacterium]